MLAERANFSLQQLLIDGRAVDDGSLTLVLTGADVRPSDITFSYCLTHPASISLLVVIMR